MNRLLTSTSPEVTSAISVRNASWFRDLEPEVHRLVAFHKSPDLDAALADPGLYADPADGARTTTERPFLWLTTRTFIPSGRVRWAAVSPSGLYFSPDAVRPGCWYQAARVTAMRRPI